MEEFKDSLLESVTEEDQIDLQEYLAKNGFLLSLEDLKQTADHRIRKLVEHTQSCFEDKTYMPVRLAEVKPMIEAIAQLNMELLVAFEVLLDGKNTHKYRVLRPIIDGKAQYCRILIRRKQQNHP